MWENSYDIETKCSLFCVQGSEGYYWSGGAVASDLVKGTALVTHRDRPQPWFTHCQMTCHSHCEVIIQILELCGSGHYILFNMPHRGKEKPCWKYENPILGILQTAQKIKDQHGMWTHIFQTPNIYDLMKDAVKFTSHSPLLRTLSCSSNAPTCSEWVLEFRLLGQLQLSI